jgi:plastocyanin
MNISRAIFLSIVFSCSSFAKEVTVDIYKFAFNPANITVVQGDTVIWLNKEKRQYHNVWFKALFKNEPEYLFPDDSYRYTFNNIGDFSYQCGPHPRMKGLVSVVSAK